MANFDLAFEHIIKVEGGYANNPADKGGETLCGVSRRWWPKWEVWAYIDYLKGQPGFPDNIPYPLLTPYLYRFYRVEFWTPIGGQQIQNQGVAEAVFDMAVNTGIRDSVEAFQRSLNLLGASLVEDGICGGKTIAAVNDLLRNGRSAHIIMLMLAGQIADWVESIEKDPSQRAFLKGWLNRQLSFVERYL